MNLENEMDHRISFHSVLIGKDWNLHLRCENILIEWISTNISKYNHNSLDVILAVKVYKIKKLN